MRKIEPKRYVEYLAKHSIEITEVKLYCKQGLLKFDLRNEVEEDLFCRIKELEIFNYDYIDNLLILISFNKVKYNKAPDYNKL